MTFPEGRNEFFWVSDRDGYQHVYRYDYSGKLIQQVTRGHVERHAHRGHRPGDADDLLLDAPSHAARAPALGGQVRRHGHAPHHDGAGEPHASTCRPTRQYFIDTLVVARRSRSRSSCGPPSAASCGRWRPTRRRRSGWRRTSTRPPSCSASRPSDGVKIDASMVKPVPFDPTKKYPVVFDDLRRAGLAGGVQPVRRRRLEPVARAERLHRRRREQPRHEQLRPRLHEGRLQAARQIRGARTSPRRRGYLTTLPYVDGARIAIMGTSYGGYSTMITMELYPGLFTVGIANSRRRRLAPLRHDLHRALHVAARRQPGGLQAELRRGERAEAHAASC